MTGSRCPECARPRNRDGSAAPGCNCAERVGAALRAERDADIAAAENFDPLRIRPYVTLGSLQGAAEASGDPATGPGRPVASPDGSAPFAGGAPVPTHPAGVASAPAAGPSPLPDTAGIGPGPLPGAPTAGPGPLPGMAPLPTAGPGPLPGTAGPGPLPGTAPLPSATAPAPLSSTTGGSGPGPETVPLPRHPGGAGSGPGRPAPSDGFAPYADGATPAPQTVSAPGGTAGGGHAQPGAGAAHRGGFAPVVDGTPAPGTHAAAPVPGAETAVLPPLGDPGAAGYGPADSGAGTAHQEEYQGGGPPGPMPPPAAPGDPRAGSAAATVGDTTAPAWGGGAGPVPDAPDELELYVADPGAQPRPRRRGFAGIAVGAAALAVAGTAAFAGGLFSGGDERDRALPPDTRSSAPSASAVPDAPAESVSPTGSASAAPSESASASPSTSPSPSPSRATPSAAPGAADAPAAPSAPPSTAQATGTVSEAPSQRPGGGGTLRRGDSGPAVAELQSRLRQLGLYPHDEADGRFDEDVEQAVKLYQWDRGIDRDPLGVYGPHTRRALEAETGWA
ncbi:peptidoglycan-binding protein [Streptomyces xantholiticus]|uniref:Peptidoglycan-binding protein n=1 Tax=Streptomyces xantholiticus TaxID=68285 RepID=A0ABV1V3J9_9ACTN